IGERMADFVANTLLANPPGALDDTVGNVGLVAGAAGHVKGNQPTTFAANGSVSNLSASNIMSMVAGSVDLIASIQKISNIVVTTTGGIFGADKEDPGNGFATGTIDYYDPQPPAERHDHPVINGALIDGAIVGK